jgi:hypothetical protein
MARETRRDQDIRTKKDQKEKKHQDIRKSEQADHSAPISSTSTALPRSNGKPTAV